MIRTRTVADLEADLVALRAAAERAGTALACLFSSSDEFEAEVIRARRAQGAFPARTSTRYFLRSIGGAGLVVLLVFTFLML